MTEKFREIIEEITRANNAEINSRKNLFLTIIAAICGAVVMGVIYYFTRDIQYIVVAVLAMIPLICYAIYAFHKEKRQDKSSEKDMQEFLSGARYRKKEWKTAYYKYKGNHTFETISKKGMIDDLKKRYRAQGKTMIRIGILLVIGSILIIIYSDEVKNKITALMGILFGIAIFMIGFPDYTAVPVKKCIGNRTDLAKIEKSYERGKMLSYNDNGINLGSEYTVLYKPKMVYVLENELICDMTRKMVRVKQYEDNLYSGQEYRYYISVKYKSSGGKTEAVDIRLDEFQCEMMITEFHRMLYPEREYDSTVLEKTENTVTV